MIRISGASGEGEEKQQCAARSFDGLFKHQRFKEVPNWFGEGIYLSADAIATSSLLHLDFTVTKDFYG